MEENRKCDGHCDRCNVNQRSYCASQIAYYNMQEIASIKAMLLQGQKNEGLTIIGNESANVEDPNIENESNEE